MNLLAAIIDFYENNADSTAVAIRSALGTSSKMWTDNAPETTAMPYCVVSEISTTPVAEGKNNAFRVDAVKVQFDVFDTGKADVDSILEAIENAYLRNLLTVTNRNHLASAFINRLNMEEERVYHGIVEIDFLLGKTPQ